VTYRRADGSTGGCSSPADSLVSALRVAIETGTYYVGLGYTVAFDVEEHCDHCKGLGQYRTGKRVAHWHKCKACHGETLQRKIGPVPVLVHPNCKILNDAA